MNWFRKTLPLGVVSLVALTLGACGREGDFSGPAPAGALECALAHGRASGFELIEGSVQARSLRLAHRLPPPPAQERGAGAEPNLADVVLLDPADVPVENQLLVSEERGRLRIVLLGINHAGARVGAGSNADDLARTILALCTTTPPVPP